MLSGVEPAAKPIRHAAALFEAECFDPVGHGIVWDCTKLDEAAERAESLRMDLMPWEWFALAVYLARRNLDGTPATRYLLFSAGRGSGKTGLAQLLTDIAMHEGKDRLIAAMATSQEKANELHERLSKHRAASAGWRSSGGGASTGIGRLVHGRSLLKCFPCKVTHMDSIVANFIYLDEVARMAEGVHRAITAVIKNRECQLLMTTTPDPLQRSREVWAHWNPLQRCVLDGTPFPRGWWLLEYTTDPDDDPTAEETIRKANPSAGVLVSVQDCIDQVRKALSEGDPHAIEDMYAQVLATFNDSATGAIALELIDRQSEPIELEAMRGMPAVVAVDFSQGGHNTTNSQCDLTSLAVLAWDGTRVLYKGWHWWAGASIDQDERRSKMPLQRWAEAGLLTRCPGETIDYGLIEARIQAIEAVVDLRALVADPVGKACAWAAHMEAVNSWKWFRAPQNIVWMGSAWAIFADWVRGGKLALATDPVFRESVRCARLHTGLTSLAFPVKQKSPGNIDPLTACIMGVKCINETQVMRTEAYRAGEVFF